MKVVAAAEGPSYRTGYTKLGVQTGDVREDRAEQAASRFLEPWMVDRPYHIYDGCKSGVYVLFCMSGIDLEFQMVR